PAPLAARKVLDAGVTRRTPQSIHGDLDPAFQIPGVGCLDLFLQFGLLCQELVEIRIRISEGFADGIVAINELLQLPQPFHHVAGNVLAGIELWFLRQITDLYPLRGPGFADKLLIDARHDAQKRRLAGAIQAQHADLGTGQKMQMNVLKNLLAAGIGLGETLHGVDILVGCHWAPLAASLLSPGEWMVAGILARAGDRSMRAFPRRTSCPHLSRRRRHHADLAHPWMRCPKYGSGPRKCK